MTGQKDPTFREILLEKAGAFPFFKLIGLEVLDAAPGRSSSQVTWRPDLTQPAGLMHGGVIAALIDTGIAYSMLLCDELHDLLEGGGSLVSIDLRVKYLRPVSQGTVTCEARVVRMGRRVIHADAVVTDEQGKEVARGDCIYTPVTAEQIRGA
jgi:acyl-CoA thioesterase